MNETCCAEPAKGFDVEALKLEFVKPASQARNETAQAIKARKVDRDRRIALSYPRAGTLINAAIRMGLYKVVIPTQRNLDVTQAELADFLREKGYQVTARYTGVEVCWGGEVEDDDDDE